MNRLQLFLGFILVAFFATGVDGQTGDSVQIRTLEISGNVRTKTAIVLREIPINIGQFLLKNDIPSIVEQCKTNLIKTSLFNFVDIDWNIVDSNQVDFKIKVQERWYYIPRARIKTLEENINAWAERMDFNHLSATLSVTDENFRGYNEKLTVSGSIGFNRAVGIEYLKPSFVITKNLGIGMLLKWNSNREAAIGLFDYKPEYLRITNEPLVTKYQGEIMFYYRPQINIDELLSVGFIRTNYHDLLSETNRTWYPNKSTNLIRLYSKFKIDLRNHKSYPTNGSYNDLIIEKIVDAKPSTQRIDYTLVELNSRWYKRFANKIFGSAGITFATTSNNFVHPYGLGIGQSGLEVRSFEQYIIPVNAAAIGRLSLKYQLMERTKQHLKITGNPKFDLLHYALYATIFSDGAWVNYQRNANYEEKLHLKTNLLSSAGIGIDFTSYYDLVVRLEYSYNFVLEKTFLFLHFKASI